MFTDTATEAYYYSKHAEMYNYFDMHNSKE